jgi:ActR/RegA family two-component response regulator
MGLDRDSFFLRWVARSYEKRGFDSVAARIKRIAVRLELLEDAGFRQSQVLQTSANKDANPDRVQP